MDQQAALSSKPGATFPKQAVVIIHGIGEQRPMDTIKGFVRAVWEHDNVLTKNGLPNEAEVWSKPDFRTGSLELRRITTRESIPTSKYPIGVRSDFYERYWADLSGGTTWHSIQNWIAGLLFRNPFSRVPPNLFLAWTLLWILSLIVVILTIATFLPSPATIGSADLWACWPFRWLAGIPRWQLAACAILCGAITRRFIVPYVGRIVRYTSAKPDNIAARQNIRHRGLVLLENLHSSSEYERIIVVGHSLGSILAYDLISYFWAARLDSRTVVEDSAEFQALQNLEKTVAELEKAPAGPERSAAIASFLIAQRVFGEALRARPKPKANEPDRRWLISDLITLGSPLSYANFLIAKSEEDLRRRQKEREDPTSPPIREQLVGDAIGKAKNAKFELDENKPQLLCFPFGEKKQWQLHHAAPFAAVRWTNIYDPAFAVFCGDIISGPVAPTFGPGVIDVSLKNLQGRQSLRFTHTRYWAQYSKSKASPQVLALRNAIDLGAQRFP
jgi:hypothetical protein